MFGHSSRHSVRIVYGLTVVGLVVVCGLLYTCLRILDSPLLWEEPPIFDALHIGQTLVLAFLCALFVLFTVRMGCVGLDGRRVASAPAGIAARERLAQGAQSSYLGWAALGLTLGLSWLFTAVFVASPVLFNRLALEGGVIERASACGCFVAAVVSLLALAAFPAGPKRQQTTKRVLALGLALLFLLIGMEETSWFQQDLNIRTPGLFAANHQGEMNLHNYATNITEIIYYSGVFVFLVLLPFIDRQTLLPVEKRSLSVFVPAQWLMLCGAVPVAYNHDMWNNYPTQLAFFLTLFILLYTLRYPAPATPRPLVLVVLATVVATQVVFLLNSDSFVRLWDVTEYKELLIPLCFVFYALDLWRRAAEQRRRALSCRP